MKIGAEARGGQPPCYSTPVEHAFIWVPEMKLLVKTLEGRATAEDVIHSMDEELEIGLGHTDLAKLIDMRNAQLDMTTADVKRITRWYAEHGLASCEACIAVITSEPLPTALAMVYSHALARVRPAATFSTPRAAVEWLGLDPTAVAQHWPEAASR